MIPSVIYWRLNIFYRKIIISSVFILIAAHAFAQEQTLDYYVTYKGDNVGNMQLYQKTSGNNVYIKIVSAVQMRFILNIKILSEEESIFKNGKLVYSRIKRNVNGKENSYKQTKASGDIYQTSSGDRKYANKNMLIDYNLHLLYAYEPENIRKVYSDNFQQFVPIQKVGPHQYKITLPDGNYNYYSFKNGVCSLVEIHSTLYNIQFRLKEN